MPGPGSLPDADSSDDLLTTTFDGGSSGYGRAIRQVAVAPSTTMTTGDSFFDITLVVDIHGGGTQGHPDLSSEAELFVNGLPRGSSISWGIQLGGPTGECGLGCGSSCGALYVDGVLNTMLCHEDEPDDCDCGYWITGSFPGEPLQPGDEIMVLLRPAPGALPDPDGQDEIATLSFDGLGSGWNRSVQAVTVNDLGGGIADLLVDTSVALRDVSGFADLSFVIDVEADGVVIASQLQTARFDPLGPAKVDCQIDCSGGSCGAFGVDPQTWIAAQCLPWPGFAGCSCGVQLMVPIPAVPLPGPGVVLKVILRPAPGALPELPGFEEDDERRPDTSTGVEDHPVRRRTPLLDQNHPNPFNPTTTIRFRTEDSGRVSLDIFDIRGNLVRRLVDENRGSGSWSVQWDGHSDRGARVASGHYLYRLRTSQGEESRKMTLLK
jgi:FlgD Ig-like domain